MIRFILSLLFHDQDEPELGYTCSNITTPALPGFSNES